MELAENPSKSKHKKYIMKKSLFFAITMAVCIYLSSCANSKEEEKTISIANSSDVEISGDYTDIFTVVPGDYILKKKNEDSGIKTQTISIKIKLRRTATAVEDNFEASNFEWKIQLTDVDGAQISNGELQLQKGSLDNTEAEKFTKWIKAAQEGEENEFLFSNSMNNADLASEIIEKVKSFMITTGSKSSESVTDEIPSDSIIDTSEAENTAEPSDNEAIDSEQGNIDYDEFLNSYEEYVNKYIKFIKRAAAGDMNAMSEYPALLEKAKEYSDKIENAKGEMSTEQWTRFTRIQQKMLKAMK